MMHNVSASGFVATLRASKTFPSGIQLTAWADDADPFDIPPVIAATADMNLNGEMVVFNSPTPVPLTINLIAGSPDDENMSILLDANTAGFGKTVAQDVITLTGTYPDGRTVDLSEGVLISGIPTPGIASAGRLKSKAWAMTFTSSKVSRKTGVAA